MADCTGYLTVAEVRAEYGDDVSELTDAQIQRKIDRLAGELEAQLGHTFGRAAIASSTGADALVVTALGVTIGGDAYLFATYTTLGALAAAINAAGDTYTLELLPQVNPSTPSTLLKLQSSVTIGPDYEDRVVLCLSGMWLQPPGGQTHLFLPLPIQSVTSVTENAIALTSAYYWGLAGEPWLIRKYCGCASTSTCIHPRGHWSCRYPGNIEVVYVPIGWGRPPGGIRSMMLEAFGLQAGAGDGGLQSESFGEYSYSRRAGASYQGTWMDALGGAAVRQWSVRFMP